MINEPAFLNKDKILWKEEPDFYAASIYETESGSIGINVGGSVLVAPVREWHKAGEMIFTVPFNFNKGWRYNVACRVYLLLVHKVVRPLFDWLRK